MVQILNPSPANFQQEIAHLRIFMYSPFGCAMFAWQCFLTMVYSTVVGIEFSSHLISGNVLCLFQDEIDCGCRIKKHNREPSGGSVEPWLAGFMARKRNQRLPQCTSSGHRALNFRVYQECHEISSQEVGNRGSSAGQCDGPSGEVECGMGATIYACWRCGRCGQHHFLLPLGSAQGTHIHHHILSFNSDLASTKPLSH